MTRTYPKVAIYITRASSAELYAKVLDGTLDVAIAAHPSFSIPKACDWRELRKEALVLLTPKSMPRRKPHIILASEPVIRQDRNTWAGQLIDGYLRSARIRPHERFEIDGFEPIAILVDHGLGVALVHDWPPPWPEGLSVTKMALPANAFGRQVGALWMRASIRGRLIRIFLDVAETTLTSSRRRRLSTLVIPFKSAFGPGCVKTPCLM